MDGKAFDQVKADSFLRRMVVNMINESCLSLMVNIGYQTGLFDKMANLPAATSLEISEAAELNERYVREWLGAMVTGKIIDFNPETEQYWLSAEHAAFLTRDAGADNMSPVLGFIPVLAAVEKEIVDCFQNGGGVPYEAFPEFHHVMADGNKAAQDTNLVEVILPIVTGLVERLNKGIYTADIGCGQGHIGNLMAQAFPLSEFIGFDFVEDNILAANQEAESMGLKNIRFVQRDITHLNEVGRYDLITAFDAIHDQAHPDVVLKNVVDALKPGGIFFMVDIAASSYLAQNLDLPMGPFLYTVSCMHCMAVSLAYDGAGLGAVWGKELATEMLLDAGFQDVEVKKIDGFSLNYYYIASKGEA